MIGWLKKTQMNYTHVTVNINVDKGIVYKY